MNQKLVTYYRDFEVTMKMSDVGRTAFYFFERDFKKRSFLGQKLVSHSVHKDATGSQFISAVWQIKDV